MSKCFISVGFRLNGLRRACEFVRQWLLEQTCFVNHSLRAKYPPSTYSVHVSRGVATNKSRYLFFEFPTNVRSVSPRRNDFVRDVLLFLNEKHRLDDSENVRKCLSNDLTISELNLINRIRFSRTSRDLQFAFNRFRVLLQNESCSVQR